MSIYINRNNQQMGPFEEAKVLEMLKSGQLSPNDLAIRHGASNWQKLGDFFPNAASNPVVNNAVNQTVNPAAAAPKKSRKGLLLGCGGVALIGLLLAAVLGFIAFRNLRPADSQEDLPNTVKDMKLNERYPPKGDIWGTKSEFVGIYSDPTKTQTVLYFMTVYKNEEEAKDAFRSELAKSCKTGETPMHFSFIDKSGKEVSQGATCAAPLLVQKDNKFAMIGGTSASVDTLIEFAENLPFNAGSTMKKKEDK